MTKMKAKRRKFFQGRQKGDKFFLKLILKVIIANRFTLKCLTKLSYMSCGSNSHLSSSGICTATIKRETIIGKNKKNYRLCEINVSKTKSIKLYQQLTYPDTIFFIALHFSYHALLQLHLSICL